MEASDKLTLKRVELSLTKFNEVAIPHHLDLLRQHKANIIMYETGGEWARVRSEQTHARRVAGQLRALLAEVDALRSQVRPEDHSKFDANTQRSRDLTLKAIVDYLGVIESSCKALMTAAQRQLNDTSPLSINRSRAEAGERLASGSVASTDSVGVVAQPELVQLHVDEHELALREREAVLRGWCELQTEVRALHAAWQHMQHAAIEQQHLVDHSAANVDTAAQHVEEARRHLWAGERLRAGAYGAGGAMVGALVGGPLGLAVGAKAAGVALLAGSALGYWSARLLAKRRQLQLDESAPPDELHERKTQ